MSQSRHYTQEFLDMVGQAFRSAHKRGDVLSAAKHLATSERLFWRAPYARYAEEHPNPVYGGKCDYSKIADLVSRMQFR